MLGFGGRATLTERLAHEVAIGIASGESDALRFSVLALGSNLVFYGLLFQRNE